MPPQNPVHRLRRTTPAGLAAAAIVAAAVALSAAGAHASMRDHHRHHKATHVHRKHPGRRHGRVHLVAFDGDQLPGFTVSEIPAGWHLSTSVSTALCITPDGSTNDEPYDFDGKLCVMPQSVDELGLGPGDPVTVNGQPGRVDADDGPAGELQLRYITTDGHTVDIQSPPALGWTDDQIVAFAEGVTVTEHIGVTHG